MAEKGFHPKTEFKKGYIPHNKNKNCGISIMEEPFVFLVIIR